jgi:hypothetical protein
VKASRSIQNAHNFVLAMVNHHEDGYVLRAASQMWEALKRISEGLNEHEAARVASMTLRDFESAVAEVTNPN